MRHASQEVLEISRWKQMKKHGHYDLNQPRAKMMDHRKSIAFKSSLHASQCPAIARLHPACNMRHSSHVSRIYTYCSRRQKHLAQLWAQRIDWKSLGSLSRLAFLGSATWRLGNSNNTSDELNLSVVDALLRW